MLLCRLAPRFLPHPDNSACTDRTRCTHGLHCGSCNSVLYSAACQMSPEELHLEYCDSKQCNWEMYRCCQTVSRTMGKLADSVESFNCSSKSSLALCFQDHGHSSSACLWNGRTANLKLWAVKLSCEQQQYQCQQLLL